jgi:hypothetical protein
VGTMSSALSFKQLLVLMLVVLVGIQFVPVDRTNPPVETRTVGPEGFMSVLRRSCFECHSNETVWPWYGGVAPVSWLVARDISRGREALNFSTWNRLSAREQDELRAKVWRSVKNGDMPPPFYMLGNPDAQVTTDHHPGFRNWAGVPSG